EHAEQEEDVHDHALPRHVTRRSEHGDRRAARADAERDHALLFVPVVGDDAPAERVVAGAEAGLHRQDQPVAACEARLADQHVESVVAHRRVPRDDGHRAGGAAPLVRVLHPVAVHYEGSGFYSTDYGRGSREGTKESGRDSGSSDSGNSSDSGTSSSSSSDSGSSGSSSPAAATGD